MLYYKAGTIPNSKPQRIRLPDGTTITDPTHDQLIDNGWYVAPDMPSYTHPNVLEWQDPNWVVRGPNQQEVEASWESIKRRCEELLAATDYKVIKAVEAAVANGTSLSDELPAAYITYRQALRDIYNNVNNLDPFNIEWPVLPT